MPRHVSLNVQPIKLEDGTKLALAFFLDGGSGEGAPSDNAGLHDEAGSALVKQLRSELSTAQNHLLTARAQYDSLTEELRASNDELQSMNEEYRSTAEELETSKEELQSMNEELQTLNNELKLKLDVVSRANNDLQNLMSTTDVATLFLSATLRINRYTPGLVNIINVAAGDEGRPISDFTHQLEYNDLARDAKMVLADLAPIERTVHAHDGRWLLMRVRPYRTLEGRVDGVIITFVDVTEQRQAEERCESRQRLLLAELSHRVKSTIATVEAIVAQTALENNANASLRDAINSRLQAFAFAHELLIAQDWGSVELEAIADSQLQGLIGGEQRVQLGGPRITLPAQSAILLGLLFHELAANAIRCGALSQPAGKVSIVWQAVEGDQGHRLKMTWKEVGGPGVVARSETGIAGFLIARGFPDGKVTREYRPEGLICTVEIPITGATVHQAVADRINGHPVGSPA